MDSGSFLPGKTDCPLKVRKIVEIAHKLCYTETQ